MNATTRTLPAERFRALVGELEAIASVELEAELAAMRHGEPLDLAQLDHLEAYLREECQTHGLLTREQLRETHDAKHAARIVRQTRALLNWLAS